MSKPTFITEATSFVWNDDWLTIPANPLGPDETTDFSWQIPKAFILIYHELVCNGNVSQPIKFYADLVYDPDGVNDIQQVLIDNIYIPEGDNYYIIDQTQGVFPDKDSQGRQLHFRVRVTTSAGFTAVNFGLNCIKESIQ